MGSFPLCEWSEVKWKWKSLSCVWLFATHGFVEFSRPEYRSGQPFPSPGDLPNPGIEPGSPALQMDSLPTELSGKPLVWMGKIQRMAKTELIFPKVSTDSQLPATSPFSLSPRSESLESELLSSPPRPTCKPANPLNVASNMPLTVTTSPFLIDLLVWRMII